MRWRHHYGKTFVISVFVSVAHLAPSLSEEGEMSVQPPLFQFCSCQGATQARRLGWRRWAGCTEGKRTEFIPFSLTLFPGLRAFIIRAWRMGLGDYTPRWWISYGRGSAKRKWICLLRARLRTARSSFSLSPPSPLGLDALAHKWPRTYMFFRLSGCSQMFYLEYNQTE